MSDLFSEGPKQQSKKPEPGKEKEGQPEIDPKGLIFSDKEIPGGSDKAFWDGWEGWEEIDDFAAALADAERQLYELGAPDKG